MAGVDFSRKLLGAGASVKTDFAAAQARTGLDFVAAARFKRGIKAELGIEAFANASAELSKFVHANVEGTAFARAKAGIQLQLPLNLFSEFGFAARAEAIAEAAVGLEVDLGLSIGDFVLLAKRDPQLIGLPLELLLLFLEEVNIGGAFEVNVSASAKAHASVTVMGSVLAQNGEKAGFYFTADAGVGLAAGVGIGLKAGAEFDDFRRFYGRAVDKSVDATIREILQILPPGITLPGVNIDLNAALEAFVPVAKIALRTAYEIGLKVTENNPGNSKSDAATLCDNAVQVFLEEAQRFIFNKLLESGLLSLKKMLEQAVPALAQGAWDRALPQRTALADALLSMPDEPFKAEHLAYWQNLITSATALAAAINNTNPDLDRALSIIYCTYELLMEAVRSKINTTTAYASAIGAGTISADKQPFKGQPANQPPARLKSQIKAAVNSTAAHLSYEDLVKFLLDDLIVDHLLATVPELKQFMAIYKNSFQKTEKELVSLFLQNVRSFDPANSASSQADPHKVLEFIVSGIDTFLTDTIKNLALPYVSTQIKDPVLKLYIEEVLYEAVLYMKDVGLKTILNWENNPLDNEDFTESLAGVMMLLLGRSVVVIADTFISATQEQCEDKCNALAVQLRSAADNPAGNNVSGLIIRNDPDFIRVTADCLEVGGKILGPLPEATRSRIRSLLYQVFEPIPAGKGQSFADSLQDQFFIPNFQDMQSLTMELKQVAQERFGLFVEHFLARIGQYLLEKLEDLIRFVIDLVVNWEKQLASALLNLAAFISDLEETTAQLNQQAITLMSGATTALHVLFQSLSGNTLKNSIKRQVKTVFVNNALGLLDNNPVYRILPSEIKAQARGLANSAVDGAFNNPVINPIFDAISAVANQLDSLVPDARELDPNANLPEQLMQLILDRIEDKIRDVFGRNNPQIQLAINFSYQLPEVHNFQVRMVTHYAHIQIGTIEVPINQFINLIRDAIEGLDFYHDQLNEAGLKLADAFAKELELTANRLNLEDQRKEQRRLNQLKTEHNNEPKEIAVVSPVALAHYTSSIDVKVHLGGVPMSYLGLGKDEIQRVLIYVNGQLVPVKSLVAAASSGQTVLKDHLKDIDFRNIVKIDGVTGNISNAFDAKNATLKTASVNIITDSTLYFPAQKANKNLSTGPTLPKGNTGNAFLRKEIGLDKNGRLISNYTIENVLPGTKLTPITTDRLLNERIPGIMVEFKLDLDDPMIIEGINVLTVVVIEKGGARHQQNVTFTVAEPAILHKPTPGVVRKWDPVKGIETISVISIGKVLEQYVLESKKDPKKALSPAAADAFTKKMEAIKKDQKLAKAKLINVSPALTPAILRTEKLTITDDKGKTQVKNISYAFIGERTAALEKLGIDQKKFRIKTDGVGYEETLHVLDNKGKLVEAVTNKYTAADNRNMLLSKTRADLLKKYSNSVIILSAPQQQIQVKNMTPVNAADFAKKNAFARNYLKEQSDLNFK